MPIGLGLVSSGRARAGKRLMASAPLCDGDVSVIVTKPVFFDPEGERVRA